MAFNKITAAGIKWSHGDLITREVWKALKADGQLSAYFEGQIYRRSVYFPQAAGSNQPRLIIAAIERTEEGAISSRMTGSHRVGIVIEFQEAVRNLESAEPTVDSVLTRIQTVIEEHAGFVMDPDDPITPGGLGNLTYGGGNSPGGKAWGRLNFQPVPVQGSAESAVTFFVGISVNLAYKITFPGRATPGLP